MIHQLRVYEINPDLKQQFNERFRDHASRIMKNYGFTIVSMWFSEVNNKTEFVYILKWDNEEAMNTKWNEFMADQEWKDIKAQTLSEYGEMVLGKVVDQVLEDTSWFNNNI